MHSKNHNPKGKGRKGEGSGKDVSKRGQVCEGANILVCFCVCMCREKGGRASTSLRHNNYACPLVQTFA